MKYYAIVSPRGFANEFSALKFSSIAARDAYVEEVTRKHNYSCEHGAWNCSRREAEKIAASNRLAARTHRKNSAYPANYGACEIVEAE